MTAPESPSELPNFDLSNRVAVVTGASRGIGLAIARGLARAGAKVVMAARKPEALEAAAGAVRSEGGEALAVTAHTGKPETIAALVERTTEAYGGVDILVNNAATNPHFGPFLTADDRAWDKTIEVNLKGYFRMVQACVPSMEKRGGGRIINIASVAGVRPQPAMGLYCVSKAGVVMMTKVLAVELADKGITSNVVCPGFVRTKFSSVLWQTDAIREKVVAGIPQHRLADPEDIAGVACYVASDAASFMTGAVLEIDGGQLSTAGIHL